MTITTVRDLLEMLERFDPGSPIMIAHQPSWPLAETLAAVVDAGDIPEAERDDDEPDHDPATVWLVAGGQSYGTHPHAPSWVFEGAEL